MFLKRNIWADEIQNKEGFQPARTTNIKKGLFLQNSSFSHYKCMCSMYATGAMRTTKNQWESQICVPMEA